MLLLDKHFAARSVGHSLDEESVLVIFGLLPPKVERLLTFFAYVHDRSDRSCIVWDSEVSILGICPDGQICTICTDWHCVLGAHVVESKQFVEILENV